MEVDDALLNAGGSPVHLGILLALPPCQSVEPEQVSVLGLYHMLLGSVSVGGTYGDEIGGISDGSRDCWQETSAGEWQEYTMAGSNANAPCFLSSALLWAGEDTLLNMHRDAAVKRFIKDVAMYTVQLAAARGDSRARVSYEAQVSGFG